MVSKTLFEDVSTNWQIMGIIRMTNCPFSFFIRQKVSISGVQSLGESVTFLWRCMLAVTYFLRTKLTRSPSQRVILSFYFTTRTQFTYYLFCYKTFLNLQSHIWPAPPGVPLHLRILSVGHMPRGIITLWFSPLLDHECFETQDNILVTFFFFI